MGGNVRVGREQCRNVDIATVPVEGFVDWVHGECVAAVVEGPLSFGSCKIAEKDEAKPADEDFFQEQAGYDEF
ncbi:Os06g0721187 [Oryza sativa Japonica Group]|uniref:Os06g0721187 protein n=1 Tax=Oryza sativa subsp. japonica TaxID=39947 RepID=A0A0P0X1D2_ORYSJ|nr:Os06g0721187 [Oryza sativa Japonica Group]